jgi:hypothetical protein
MIAVSHGHRSTVAAVRRCQAPGIGQRPHPGDIVMSVLSLRSWLAVFFLMLAVGLAPAADKKPADKPVVPPPDLDGRTYTVTFPTEDKKPKEKLIFKEGKLTLTSLGELEIAYKAKVKANSKGVVSETKFSGSATATDGAKIEIDGAVSSDGEIRGSITRREKDIDATARNFNGKQTAGKK